MHDPARVSSSRQPPPRLTVRLAGPRGFCAGVDRAIKIVEEALRRFGPPVYVRHEIVHNRFVVETLEAQGAVFVEELDAVPTRDHRPHVPVVFSAHGVPKSVPADAEARGLYQLDATCPLVTKVHREAAKHFAADRHLVLIGHAGHPEVIGTMGQLPPGAVTLVENVEDARSLPIPSDGTLAYITQTTLSVDDTAEIIDALRERFPAIEGPRREDICYATTNRQAAVKAIAPGADLVIVIGAPNSSNSLRLVEVALRSGSARALMVQRARELDLATLADVSVLGLTAGASAPEALVDEMIAHLRTRFDVAVEEVRVAEENIVFRLPSALASA